MANDYIVKNISLAGFDPKELDNFWKNPRERKYAFLLTPKGISEKSALAHRFIRFKRQEYEDLRGEIKALEAEARLSTIPDVTSQQLLSQNKVLLFVKVFWEAWYMRIDLKRLIDGCY